MKIDIHSGQQIKTIDITSRTARNAGCAAGLLLIVSGAAGFSWAVAAIVLGLLLAGGSLTGMILASRSPEND